MTASTIGIRYARALFNLAQEASEVARLGRELEELTTMWRSSDELRRVLENPAYAADVRRQLVTDLAEKAQLSQLLRNTLALLADRRRLQHLPEIAEAYRGLAEEKAGVVRAEVITASELSDAYYQELQKALEGVTGKQVVVVSRVDPGLIGGVVTKVGGRVFDGSVKHRLEGLKESLLLQT